MSGAPTIFTDHVLTDIAGSLGGPDTLGVPTIEDRGFWNRIAGHPALTALLAEAGAIREAPWATLPARGYLRYARDGNRIVHEQQIRARQERLTLATLAAAASDGNDWLDEVADGALLLCEQTSWCWPAHDEAYARGLALPDVTAPVLDLGAGEVAAQLAWVDHVLGPRLESLAPGLRTRLRHEVRTRVIDPFLSREWHWLGLDGNIHNWNPWIHQNVLTAALLVLEDRSLREQVVRRCLWGLEIYLQELPSDGAIDEGFDYWWNGACRALEGLDLVERATDGAFRALSVPTLRATVDFPISVWLGGAWCYSFSDSHPPLNPRLPWHLLHRWARECGATDSAAFALAQRRENAVTAAEGLGRLLFALTDAEWLNGADVPAPAPSSNYLPSTDVFISHHGDFSLAAKGGHNDENHNHLDVGSVVAAWRGVPVLVDPGRATYTAQTFGPARYDLWYTRSEWHNLPEVAGHQQEHGRSVHARVLRAEPGGERGTFCLDLSPAYGAVGTWTRTCEATAGGIRVREEWSGFDGTGAGHALNWIIAGAAEATGPGCIEIRPLAGPGGPPSSERLVLSWDPALATSTVERRPLTDSYQRSAWGEQLTRVRLRVAPGWTGRGELTVTLS